MRTDLAQILGRPLALRRAVAALAFGLPANPKDTEELEPLGLADGQRLTEAGHLLAAELLLSGDQVAPELKAAARQLYGRVAEAMDTTCRPARVGRGPVELPAPSPRVRCHAEVSGPQRARYQSAMQVEGALWSCEAAHPARCLTMESIAAVMGWPASWLQQLMIREHFRRTGSYAATARAVGSCRQQVYNVLVGDPGGRRHKLPPTARVSDEDLEMLGE